MTIRVSELIRILEECDPDARVYFVAQPNYPFEYSITEVKPRSECGGGEREQCEDCGDGFMEQDEDAHGDPILQCSKCPAHKKLGRDDPHPKDVLILEGEQIRYASKKVFE